MPITMRFFVGAAMGAAMGIFAFGVFKIHWAIIPAGTVVGIIMWLIPRKSPR